MTKICHGSWCRIRAIHVMNVEMYPWNLNLSSYVLEASNRCLINVDAGPALTNIGTTSCVNWSGDCWWQNTPFPMDKHTCMSRWSNVEPLLNLHCSKLNKLCSLVCLLCVTSLFNDLVWTYMYIHVVVYVINNIPHPLSPDTLLTMVLCVIFFLTWCPVSNELSTSAYDDQ